METEAKKKLFTVDEYHRMAEAGVLGPDEGVELIEGEIIQMSPAGSRHASCVMRVNQGLVGAFGGRAWVSPQLPLGLDDYSEPEPDLARVVSATTCTPPASRRPGMRSSSSRSRTRRFVSTGTSRCPCTRPRESRRCGS